LGWLPDLYLFYSSLDLLLFNTDWEALGRTPIEAISLGTPVVASAVHSGLEEILLPAFAPVIKQHDVPLLASLCHVPLQDRERSRKDALRTREYLAAFSPEADSGRLEELLCQR
jgi:glycosyltransferase involved in cell wall biosynthesis